MLTEPAPPCVWVMALDEWDVYLSTVEDLMSVDVGHIIPSWTPPPDLKVIPEHEIPRARELLNRQQILITQLERAAVSVHDERALAVAVTVNSTQLVPRFIDVRS